MSNVVEVRYHRAMTIPLTFRWFGLEEGGRRCLVLGVSCGQAKLQGSTVNTISPSA